MNSRTTPEQTRSLRVRVIDSLRAKSTLDFSLSIDSLRAKSTNRSESAQRSSAIGSDTNLLGSAKHMHQNTETIKSEKEHDTRYTWFGQTGLRPRGGEFHYNPEKIRGGIQSLNPLNLTIMKSHRSLVYLSLYLRLSLDRIRGARLLPKEEPSPLSLSASQSVLPHNKQGYTEYI